MTNAPMPVSMPLVKHWNSRNDLTQASDFSITILAATYRAMFVALWHNLSLLLPVRGPAHAVHHSSHPPLL
jgi:hypothetical protein